MERATEAPEAFSAGFDRWTAENIAPWFRSQVAVDAAYMAALDACLAGRAPPPPNAQTSFRRAMNVLADEDREVALAVAREAHLLARPGSVEANLSVAAKVRAFMEKPREGRQEPPGPNRREFEALVG